MEIFRISLSNPMLRFDINEAIAEAGVIMRDISEDIAHYREHFGDPHAPNLMPEQTEAWSKVTCPFNQMAGIFKWERDSRKNELVITQWDTQKPTRESFYLSWYNQYFVPEATKITQNINQKN